MNLEKWMFDLAVKAKERGDEGPPNRIVTATARDGSVQFHTLDGQWTPERRRACVYGAPTGSQVLARVAVPSGHVRGMLDTNEPATPLDALPRTGALR